MSRFRIGDTVYVKPWEKLEPLLGYSSDEGVWRCPETNLWFTPDMISLCGKPLTINGYDDSGNDDIYTAGFSDAFVLLCDTFLEYDPPNYAIIEALSEVMAKYNVTFELDSDGHTLEMHSPGNETFILGVGEGLVRF